jgi:hypothetical protein
MKWLALMNLISVESDRFAAAPIPQLPKCKDNEELLEAHKKAELEWRVRVDASIRQFARHRQWPNACANEQYFIEQRLAAAFYVAGYLACPGNNATSPIFPEAPQSFLDEDQIEWILIHGWSQVGWRMWIAHQRIRLDLVPPRRLQ